ncbi:MAG TPA: GNAT family N-acetyltransferase [Ignavibacteria bacterium]|nr:GNAT family N-acetyltransferase [Ignavibacteria bacterium]
MKFNSSEVLLKNNQIAKIELCTEDDAEELIKTVKTYLADSEYLLTTPDEFDPSPEQERSWIRSFMENDNSLLLIARHRNGIIGNISITGRNREMISHTALIGMGILKEFRNTGLGTALLNKGIEWAKKNPLLEILWLQVFEENTAAVSLYKKTGFEINGIQNRFFKNRKNEYFNNVIMSLNVS